MQILITKIFKISAGIVQKNLILFFTINTTLSADDPMRFRKNFLDASL